MAAGLAGCTRRFFRRQADKEVYSTLAPKEQDPRWNLEGFTIDVDPHSRFADPTNPDRPPKPPDDPGAFDLSPNPQKPGKPGVSLAEGTGYLDLLAQWDRENRAKKAEAESRSAEKTLDDVEIDRLTREVEAKVRQELADPVAVDRALPPPEKPPTPARQPYLITMDQTVELGLILSREYQSAKEAVYLSALPVTVERAAFGVQFFVMEEALRQRSGANTPEGQQNYWQSGSVFGFSKLFSSGALMLVSLANQTVYNLGAGPKLFSQSTFSMDVVQPLLRGGGKAVALEPLTQAERNLLYAVRDFARFRQEFFVFLAAGQPTFIPGVQAGVAAIAPNTVTTPSPFTPGALPLPTPLGAVVIPVQDPPGSGTRLFPIAGPFPTPQGYLGTVLSHALVANQFRNIQALERFLRLFQVYLEGGLVNSVQVGQVEQQLLQSVKSVLSNQTSHRTDYDQLKLQLGLPLTIEIEVDDEPLRPMYEQTRRYEQVSANYEAVANLVSQYNKPEEADRLRARLRQVLSGATLFKGLRFPARMRERWERLENVPAEAGKKGERPPLDAELDRLRARRRQLLDRQAELEDRGGLPEAERERLADLEFEIDLGYFERDLRAYEARPWERHKEAARRQAQQASLYFNVQRSFLKLLGEAIRERLDQIRQSWPPLPSLCVEGVDLLQDGEERVEAAVARAALENRLDLMNQRAQLVDSWRKVAVAANALLGTLNVEYHLDSFSPASVARPLDLGGSGNRHQLILNAQPPLFRVLERNNYRSTLIAFQQQRRQLMLEEDNVLFEVRLDLRQIRATAYNYHRVQKRAIELAYVQVDQSLQAFSQPQIPTGPAPVPGAVGGPASSTGTGDPAALTTQLLTAQNLLLQAQNDLYNTWIGYLTGRMSLFRDLGIMPLDSRGVWLDNHTTCACPPPRLPPRPQPADEPRPERLPDPPPAPPAPAPAPR